MVTSIPRKRPLRNDAERKFEELAQLKGWQTSKRGWPDFACFKDGEFIAVEVKPRGTDNLSKYQYAVMAALAEYGVPCYYWAAKENEFTRIT